MAKSSSLSSSVSFSPCGAQGIHEELPSVAISSYPLDLIPWSSCVSYFILIVIRHVLFGLPLLLYPWGFQSNAVFSIAPASLRNVFLIQFHFHLFIWISIGFCHGKVISIKNSERVSVFIPPLLHSKQIASGLRRIILSSVVCLSVPYFSTLSHKRQNLGEKFLNIKCFLNSSKTSSWNISHSKKNLNLCYH
jgi:hypothetical protein